MTRSQTQSDLQKPWREARDDSIGKPPHFIPKLPFEGRGSRLPGSKRIRVQTEARRSTRLAQIRHPQEQAAYKNVNSKLQNQLSSQKSSVKDSHSTQQAGSRKRKRSQAIENRYCVQKFCSRKRPGKYFDGSNIEDAIDGETADKSLEGNPNPIDCWRETGSWPEEFFRQEIHMSYPLAKTKSSSSYRGKRSSFFSAPSSATPSDQKPREEKSAPYNHARYEIVLQTKGSFMAKDEKGINKETKDICLNLLHTEQKLPENSLFDDDIFEETCEAIEGKNEARVIRDISLLIVPSAETLARRRPKRERMLIESVNEGWNSSIPFTGTRPQPDFSTGFRRDAFTKDQLDKLRPFVGDIEYDYTSFFMGTYYMYFPFLTCEVKCGAQALDIADRQNAHSMTLAVRGIVELFRLVNREKELNREILAFSVSHDHCSVRIYGHYPVVNGKDTMYYRHTIHRFDFTALDGKEKWTAYKFTKNVYDIWMPNQFKRICSAIDQIPLDLDFEVSKEPELQKRKGSCALSRELESRHLPSRSNTDSVSPFHGDASQPDIGAQSFTPDTSVSRKTNKQSKVPKKRHFAG